jgi:hypothetical protein
MESTGWDNSCTQYGVLGVWAATRAGFDPGEGFWRTLSKHFRGCQTQDGGWAYSGNSGATHNMTTAGLASIFLVYDAHLSKCPELVVVVAGVVQVVAWRSLSSWAWWPGHRGPLTPLLGGVVVGLGT